MLKKIVNIVTLGFTVLIVLLAIVVVGLKLVGISPYVVTSGSMEPTYHVGSVVYVKDVGAEKLKKGDPITFRLGDEDTLVTHRIVDILNEGGELKFRTKGDANNVSDVLPVDAHNVVGKVLYNIPKVGFVYRAIGTKKGKAVAIFLVSVVIAIMLLEKAFSSKKRESTQDIEVEI